MDAELFPRERTPVAPGAVHVPDWLDADGQRDMLRACRVGVPPLGEGPPTGRPAHGPHSRRRHDDRPAGLPGLGTGTRTPTPARSPTATAHPSSRSPAGWTSWPAARSGTRWAHRRCGISRAHPGRRTTSRSSTSTTPAPAWACTATATRSRTPRWCPSASATPASSASATPRRVPGPTPTWSCSGDLFVFGGPSRLAHHGVPKVQPGTAPPELGLTGRLNITLRVSGL
jgi:DNA oxidative demethylase